MCCNYCIKYSKCKKLRKTNPKCCPGCEEFEFCPLIAGKKTKDDFHHDFSDNDRSDDIDMLDDELL